MTKIKAADAVFGEFYLDPHRKVCRYVECDRNGCLMFVYGDATCIRLYGNEDIEPITGNAGWDWQPPKPEPDTSLAASIEREVTILGHGMACPELANKPKACGICDRRRIIEAARKVEGLEKTIADKQKAIKMRTERFDDAKADFEAMKRGDGWRGLIKGEAIKDGDICLNSDCEPGDEKWEQAYGTIGEYYDPAKHTKHRRRIEQAEQGGASTATASEVTNDKDSEVRDAARPESESPSPMYREVNPVHDEWVERLIELCENAPDEYQGILEYASFARRIEEHMEARPKQ